MANSNPLLFRYPPNNRFINGGFKDQVETTVRIDVFGESVTDKESYRLSQASKRGSIASLAGSGQKGYYMFPDGNYDPMNDFSYIYRKDISIVEIDNYIENMKSALDGANEDLAYQIQTQIDKANKAKQKIEAKESETSIAGSE